MIEKPPHILGRETPWRLLVEAWHSENPELVFVLGRRRVGKSFTLAPFARAVKGLYYQATRRTEAEQLREITKVIGAHFADPALLQGGPFPDWESLLRYLLDRAAGERILLVLDEFPYLEAAAPALPSILQAFVDHEFPASRFKLILSGSHITAMKRLEEADQPLYARRTARITFPPFMYLDAARFVPEYSALDRLRTYGIFGGVPGHLSLLDPHAPLAENVARKILDSSARLHDEAQHVLDAFRREAAIHYSILDAIANGEHTWSGITRRTGKSAGSLSRPMQWLLDMEMVRRIVPITIRNPARSKRALYRLSDPYLGFWHRFVAPLLRTGIPSALPTMRIYTEEVAPGLDDYMGAVFEDACRTFVAQSTRMPFSPSRVGEWWSKGSEEQIDIVAFDRAGELLVGECKWGRIGRADLGRLAKRATHVRAELGGDRQVHLALFSGKGLSDQTIRAEIRAGRALHFTAEDLFSEA